MSWAQYVTEVSGGEVNRVIAQKIDLTEPSVARWRNGATKVPDAMAAARFARAYGRPVLEAFIAAGFITEAEAGARPAGRPSVADLTDDQLLEEISGRLRGRKAGEEPPALRIAARTTGQEPGTSATRRAQDQIESGSQDPGDMEPR